MNLYEEWVELGQARENLTFLTDNILDMYKKYPKECKRLLLELNNISKEFDSIEKEMKDIEKQIEKML
jgi:predicted  nucleic acid-binding Zn-ribbon protein